jgi:hypothetical protein
MGCKRFSIVARLVALSPPDHEELRLDDASAIALSAGLRSVPLAVSEFASAAVHYPLVLTKDASTGRFVIIALLGFEDSQNLFWDGTGWDAEYIPLNVRRQPFFVGSEDRDGKIVPVVLIDVDSPAWTEAGQRLFETGGAETTVFRERLFVLRKLIADAPPSDAFLAALIKLKLISPLRLVITDAQGDDIEVQGLYGVDEEAFDALPEAQTVQFLRAGHLRAFYAMLVSLGTIPSLIRRRERIQKQANRWFEQPAT